MTSAAKREFSVNRVTRSSALRPDVVWSKSVASTVSRIKPIVIAIISSISEKPALKRCGRII